MIEAKFKKRLERLKSKLKSISIFNKNYRREYLIRISETEDIISDLNLKI